MSILVFDTETTGFPDKIGYGPNPNPVQTWSTAYKNARVLEVGWNVLDAETLDVIEQDSVLLQHEGVVPEQYPGAFNAHHISSQELRTHGVRPEDGLMRFSDALQRVDMFVCHNVDYDAKMMAAEFFRYGMSDVAKHLLTMPMNGGSAKLCKIRRMSNGKWKVPRLEELYAFLFGHQCVQTHRALGDVELTVECYRELLRRGVHPTLASSVPT